MNEFIGSFLFIFTWIVLRNYYRGSQNQMNDSLVKLLNPLFITLAYHGSQTIGAPFFNGYKNPNFAIQTSWWTSSFFDYKYTSENP